MENPTRRIVKIAILLLALTIAGAVGFRIVSNLSWVDSFFMAVITLSTVGYREVVPLDDIGKVFVIIYVVFGLGTFTFCAFQLGQWLVSAEMRFILEKRRMKKTIEKLNDHCIVCGIGRMGESICHYLSGRRKEFVVIDNDEERLLALCQEMNWLCIPGDATDDAVLNKAGIDQAKSLATTLPTDADNIYVVLSARLISSKLQIIGRASDQKAIEKMEKAGANRVISPYNSGAIKMARFMINPSIEDFLEITDKRGKDLEIADFIISPDSPYVGKKLNETDLEGRGIMVIGIRRADGGRIMSPSGAVELSAQDCLFLFGNAEAINAMLEDSADYKADKIRLGVSGFPVSRRKRRIATGIYPAS